MSERWAMQKDLIVRISLLIYDCESVLLTKFAQMLHYQYGIDFISTTRRTVVRSRQADTFSL